MALLTAIASDCTFTPVYIWYHQTFFAQGFSIRIPVSYRALSSVLLLCRRDVATTVGCIFIVPRTENFTLLFNILLMLDQELDQLEAYCNKGHIKI